MTISEIKQANKSAGYHFFERSTLRFFDSRIERSVYSGPGGIYFVTSEQFHADSYSAPRKYTVRKFESDGDVNTVGSFNELGREEAMQTARRFAKSA